MILKAFLTALLLSMFTALQVSAELTGRVVDKTSGAPLEFVQRGGHVGRFGHI